MEKVPEGEKSQFLVDAILFYDQADALEQLIRKSVREELKCGNMRQNIATAEPEELQDQVLDFISMLQEE